MKEYERFCYITSSHQLDHGLEAWLGPCGKIGGPALGAEPCPNKCNPSIRFGTDDKHSWNPGDHSNGNRSDQSSRDPADAKLMVYRGAELPVNGFIRTRTTFTLRRPERPQISSQSSPLKHSLHAISALGGL